MREDHPTRFDHPAPSPSRGQAGATPAIAAAAPASARSRRGVLGLAWGVALALLAIGAASTAETRVVAQPKAKSRYVIGIVAKSSTNPVYIAARSGAEAAARALSAQHGVEVEVVWRAPFAEDSARQSELIGELVLAKADGIAVSCSDSELATTSIDRAVAAGVQVVTFDSDAPDSRRLAFYGIDDRAAGGEVMRELAAVLGGKGRVAVLAGNRAATNIRERVIGAALEANAHADLEIVGAFTHDETPEDAARAMREAHEKYGPIDGWALMGGWPLYLTDGLANVPAEAKIVSLDPLPPALAHLDRGRVQALLAQPYFGWGFESVRLLFQRLHAGEAPTSRVISAPLERVTTENADAYRNQWRSWVGDTGGTILAPEARQP